MLEATDAGTLCRSSIVRREGQRESDWEFGS